MHIHGGPFTVVQIDGNPVPRAAWQDLDTVNVGPGQRCDVIWEARRPGKWLPALPHPAPHAYDNVEVKGAGGLTTVIDVRGLS